ncbi:MAG: TetR/AcrR family transcriptional regulator [Planctomycetota bacterium]
MARPISYDPEVALERAIDLFWSRGYQAVSVDDIVRATGLNRHSLYGRYQNKYGLLQAALTRYIRETLERLRLVLQQPGRPRERIERFLALRDPQRTDPFWSCVLQRGCFAVRILIELREEHPDIAEATRCGVQEITAMLEPIIREGQAAGEFRRDRSVEELVEVTLAGYLAPLLLTPSTHRSQAYLSALN